MINLMPCGKKDCTECESCIYDIPLDAHFNKTRFNMEKFGLIPFDKNPSTSQIILPGVKNSLPPLESAKTVQLQLPFVDNSADDLYCNGCEHFVKIPKKNKSTFNTRCAADNDRQGGAYKVISLNVYPDEKVKKPFWCPILKNAITKSIGDSSSRIKVGNRSLLISGNSSITPLEQQKQWERAKLEKEHKEKWLAMSGTMSWGEIKVGVKYHMPPTLKRNRLDFIVKNKYISSIQCVNIKTGETIWFYKGDEEYKFISVIK